MCPSEHEGSGRLRSLQRDVLGYLVEHREAKDTVDGIMQWWLQGAQASGPLTDLTSALEDLVTRGWIIATNLGQGAVLYALDKSRVPDVRAFLDTYHED